MRLAVPHRLALGSRDPASSLSRISRLFELRPRWTACNSAVIFGLQCDVELPEATFEEIVLMAGMIVGGQEACDHDHN